VRSTTWIGLAPRASGGYAVAVLRQLALACLVFAAAVGARPGAAWANGRPPATSSITFRTGNDSEIVAGLTFGLAISRDGGTTWAWMCEEAIGYAGMFDPRYAFSRSGAIFASTFAGVRVMRDGCNFRTTPIGATFVTGNVIGPDETLFFAASQVADPPKGIAADFRIFRSRDDGGAVTPTAMQPAAMVSWWETLEVAPSDARRLYLSGYRYVPDPTEGTVKEHLLFRSDSAGDSWVPLPVTAFTLAPNSVIHVVGIDRDNPDLVYARVASDDNELRSSLYRSTDKGGTWEPIRTKGQAFAFLARSNGDLILGTQALGAEISRDRGDSWTPLVDPPHMNCLAENAAGEIWACTQNYGRVAAPSDDAGIMKTTDLVTWTKVLRYQDITDPVVCAAGTVQRDTCVALWCTACQQLGCVPSAAVGCAGGNSEAPPPPPPAKAGCCDGGRGGVGGLALGLAAGTLLLRPRRRRAARLT
jgi:hypothetical protein